MDSDTDSSCILACCKTPAIVFYPLCELGFHVNPQCEHSMFLDEPNNYVPLNSVEMYELPWLRVDSKLVFTDPYPTFHHYALQFSYKVAPLSNCLLQAHHETDELTLC